MFILGRQNGKSRRDMRKIIVDMLEEVSIEQNNLILNGIEGSSNYNSSEFIKESTKLSVKRATLIEVLTALEV